jgi:NADH-ubiquinone oxidoreductase chain 4
MKEAAYAKKIALIISIINLIISFVIFISFNGGTNQFQFVLSQFDLGFYNLYLGVDGQSIYFVLLTTLIVPIVLLSN